MEDHPLHLNCYCFYTTQELPLLGQTREWRRDRSGPLVLPKAHGTFEVLKVMSCNTHLLSGFLCMVSRCTLTSGELLRPPPPTSSLGNAWFSMHLVTLVLFGLLLAFCLHFRISHGLSIHPLPASVSTHADARPWKALSGIIGSRAHPRTEMSSPILEALTISPLELLNIEKSGASLVGDSYRKT